MEEIKKNRIILNNIDITENRIEYNYNIDGEWAECFSLEQSFFVEYNNSDIMNVPKSIAVIPFLGSVLPMAWVCDAEVVIPECDKDFIDNIDDVKNGYINMFPGFNFGGCLNVEKVIDNSRDSLDGVMSLFSGGVDAFNTLTMHADEKLILLSLWGADVKLTDEAGWNIVSEHLKQTAKDFNIDCVEAKTSFRRFLKEGKLDKVVSSSGDGWWHGFQHGMGIITHAAPIAYLRDVKTVYIASSFTAADKGNYTCASDPTIDNHIRFGGSSVCHDGYEFARQQKIHNIVEFCKKTGKSISLRVCWESSGGSNCCECEKCWRTILGIIAEKQDPRKFGFEYTDNSFKKLSRKWRFSDNIMCGSLRYGPIHDAMHSNWERKDIPNELKWFYYTKREKLGVHPVIHNVKRVYYVLGRIKEKMLGK